MECVERQTEHAERQTKQAERQTEHAEKQIEQAKRQTEHAARQTEQAEKKTEHAARQTEHAARQIEHVKWHTNWHTNFQPFVCKQVNEHTLTHADWPNNLIKIIKKVINVPCNSPIAPKLIFELSQTAASHNLDVLLKYQNDLSKALEANRNSPLDYGSEFRHPDKLQKIFDLHPLWPQMKQILIKGSKWSLDELSKESREKRYHRCTCLRQPQRSIGQTGTPLAFNQQRCEVRIQPPHPSVMRQINPRSLNGSYEYHDTKYDQRNWSNYPKRLTHPRSKLEMELGNVCQQQDQKRTSSGMPFWISHSSNHQLGSHPTKQLPKFPHPCNQD